MLKKIISSGQTEADRSALDVAIAMGIPHGGWVPKDRVTKIRPLPDKYKLQEMPTDNFFDCIGDSKMLHLDFTGTNFKDRKRGPWISVKHAPHTTGIDKVNPIDDFVIRYVRMPHDLNLIG